jgi:hypothetical protein
MARVLGPGRDLTPVDRARARVAALVARNPATVAVTRIVGDGMRERKVPQVVATFVAGVNESGVGHDTATGAYVAADVTALLTALRGNDAPDGVSGSPVDIQRDDQVTVTTPEGLVRHYTAGAVNAFRAHIEVLLHGRG